MDRVTFGGISRLLFASATLYKRTCFEDAVATHPDEIAVATASAVGMNRCPGFCRRVSDCEVNEAENVLKLSVAIEDRRSAGRPRLLVADIFNVLRMEGHCYFVDGQSITMDSLLTEALSELDFSARL